MKDRSGRVCKLGDLMLAMRHSGKLSDLEYVIVVGDGKVYNGSSTYTIDDYGYLCAMTDKEVDICADLQKAYKEKMLSKMKQKDSVRKLKVCDFYKDTKGHYGIYLGKVSMQSNFIENNSMNVSSVYKNGGHAYIIFTNYSHCSYSSSLLQTIQQTKSLDLSKLPAIVEDLSDTMYRDGSFHYNTYRSKPMLVVTAGETTAVSEILGQIEVINPGKPITLAYKSSMFDTDTRQTYYKTEAVNFMFKDC